jgi:hypothetical protein
MAIKKKIVEGISYVVRSVLGGENSSGPRWAHEERATTMELNRLSSR